MSTHTERDGSEFGRRAGVALLAPAVPTIDCTEFDEASDERALMSLPQGWASFTPEAMGQWIIEQADRMSRGLPARRFPVSWETMTVDEISTWSTLESARRGRVQGLGEQHGNGCPKGDWSDDEPERPTSVGCPCCGSLSIVERDDYERGWGCEDCGYGDCDSHEYLGEAGPDRQPGDGWFGGGRSGKPGMYRNDEMAAGRTVYHEGEPVSPEQQVITAHQFPASWDRPVVPVANRGYAPTRLKEGERPQRVAV